GAYMAWADHPRLADVRRHAKHAQLMFEERQRSEKEASDKELHLATITMYQNVGRNRDGGYRKDIESEANGEVREDVFVIPTPVSSVAERDIGGSDVPTQLRPHLTRLID
ncbi:hypothetical protein GOODEAATRI_034636, partial [Goodea atripinnis]